MPVSSRSIARWSAWPSLTRELARRVRVSVSYLPEVYQLRVHVRYIVDELTQRREQLAAETATTGFTDRLDRHRSNLRAA